ncbi:hypothetical protein [Jannaschia marina]|uniref:hypothetical protein n=1 Tax=Jannaschia marina TaxID=2741674 RepID=UPI0015C7B40F|nr:hypothetical protein [Jannaschia marina]
MIRVVLLCLAATGAAAQERAMTPDAFLDLVEGQTATFMLGESDALVGVERFIDRERSVWTRSDGSCALGEISVRDTKVCFVYDDDPGTNHCWQPFELAGRTYVRSTLNGEIQRLAAMEKRRLECVGEPLS